MPTTVDMPRLPVVSSKKFCALIEMCGCVFDGIEGDHYVYRRPDLVRPIVVPVRKELPVYIVLNNLHTLGMTRSDFIRALKKL